MTAISSPIPPADQRWKIIFHGCVQGVGFRQTTARIARRFAVAGYVRNRPDGTVELVMESLPETMEHLLKEIHSIFTRNIESTTKQEESPRHEFERFEIRR